MSSGIFILFMLCIDSIYWALAHSFMVMQVRALLSTSWGLDGWLVYSRCSWTCVYGQADLLFWVLTTLIAMFIYIYKYILGCAHFELCVILYIYLASHMGWVWYSYFIIYEVVPKSSNLPLFSYFIYLTTWE